MEALSKATSLLKKETATLQRVAGYAELSKVKGQIDRSVNPRDSSYRYQITHLITTLLSISEVPGSGSRPYPGADPMELPARALSTGRSLHIFPEALLETLEHITLHKIQRTAQIHTYLEIRSQIHITRTSKHPFESASGGPSLMTSPKGVGKGIVPSLVLLTLSF